MSETVYIVNFAVVIIETVALAFIIESPPFNFVMFMCLMMEILLSYKAYKKKKEQRMKM